MMHSPSFARFQRIGLLVSLVGAVVTAPLAAQSSDPAQLRAAIVFNVLRFVEFPGSQNGTIDFCVASDASDGAAFRSFSGRRAGSRTVAVRMVRAGSYSGCDAVYLGAADRDAIQRATARARLLIGSGRAFTDNGGAVGLVQSGGQVRFQLNLGSASDSQVSISSRLIRLASKVTR